MSPIITLMNLIDTHRVSSWIEWVQSFKLGGKSKKIYHLVFINIKRYSLTDRYPSSLSLFSPIISPPSCNNFNIGNYYCRWFFPFFFPFFIIDPLSHRIDVARSYAWLCVSRLVNRSWSTGSDCRSKIW